MKKFIWGGERVRSVHRGQAGNVLLWSCDEGSSPSVRLIVMDEYKRT